MKKNHDPDYARIFMDIISMKHPEKWTSCSSILNRGELSVLDILELNRLIFEVENISMNQKHKSFDEAAILQILDYQQKYNLNNSQLACHFRLSRNTVTKWKKCFPPTKKRSPYL
ncbi:helix-turn-helix domain-containing protein [Chryseobacterium sp. NRRL B-14859]|uniref:helix-turn-helix domain-containing protein n=1 Tax=unclassified Chryseobacterium TaxID=2593645 RepID=UPI000F4471EC|nr:helix-turn-helix domain-containing protein [Chryseobacterium sp. G0240]ROI04986.1 helix-turn-helix domain-containing protein [Chryseobacterium sp. G0240]